MIWIRHKLKDWEWLCIKYKILFLEKSTYFIFLKDIIFIIIGKYYYYYFYLYLNYIFLFIKLLFYYRNIKNNKYSHNIKALIYEFPNANNVERINQIFEELKASDEPNIKGIYIEN